MMQPSQPVAVPGTEDVWVLYGALTKLELAHPMKPTTNDGKIDKCWVVMEKSVEKSERCLKAKKKGKSLTHASSKNNNYIGLHLK